MIRDQAPPLTNSMEHAFDSHLFWQDLPVQMEALLKDRPDLLQRLADEKSVHREGVGALKMSAIQASLKVTTTRAVGGSHPRGAQAAWLEQMEASIKIPSTSVELIEPAGV